MAVSGRRRSRRWRAGQLGRGLEGALGVGNLVVGFVPRPQALQDRHRVGHRGLGHLHLLEAPRQRPVPLEVLAVLLPGGGTDAAQAAGFEGRLQEVGGVHGAPLHRSGPHQVVDLVHEQNGLGSVLQRLDHALQPLLEVAPVAGAGQQRPQVQGMHRHVLHGRRHVAAGDLEGQALHQRCLAHAGVAHEHRVVLPPPLEHVERAQDLRLAANDRVDATLAGQLGEVAGVGGQGVVGRRGDDGGVTTGTRRHHLLALAGRRRAGGAAPRQPAHHRQARDALFPDEQGGRAVLLVQDGHQHVAAQDLLPLGRVGVARRALDDPPEAQGGRRVHRVVLARQLLLQPGFQEGPEGRRIPAGTPQDGRGVLVVEDGQEQMLHGDVLVAQAGGLGKGHVHADLDVGGELHSGSVVSWSGIPCSRASAVTSATLVSATSLEYTPATPTPL